MHKVEQPSPFSNLEYHVKKKKWTGFYNEWTYTSSIKSGFVEHDDEINSLQSSIQWSTPSHTGFILNCEGLHRTGLILNRDGLRCTRLILTRGGLAQGLDVIKQSSGGHNVGGP